MSRICTVCSHPEVDAINRQLLSGSTYTMIANTFGVSWQAARYHILHHLPALLAKAREAEEASRASDLLAMALWRDRKALELMASAEADGDIKTAGQMLRISLVSLELLARLRHEINDQTTVNVLIMPQYLAARTAMLRALENYPEARLAVVAALLREEEDEDESAGEHYENGRYQ